MRLRLIARWVVAVCWVGLGTYFFLVPGLQLASDLRDPGLRSGKIPQAAWRLSDSLASRYAAWAQARVASQRAGQIDPGNISGTEWPLFGSVFYLWALESLQAAWEKDHNLASVAPAVKARAAIDAAARLVTDPGQAAWVKAKYGQNYLHRDDLFYRYLLIAAMTSHMKLTGESIYEKPLRDQVESLSEGIDRSPHGLVEDYPGECYPGDVVAAVLTIHRADAVLHTDHSAFVQRALRAFVPPQVREGNTPGFNASALTGVSFTPSRGSGNSYILCTAPELWPDTARVWYGIYEKHFWQRRLGIVGFREFAQGTPEGATFADVDSGAVILDFGMAASAYGVAAARVNGRMDQAGPMTAEMLACSWPMPGGWLMIPRLLSNAADAPYLGEAAILYCLTRQPIVSQVTPCASVMTPFTWLILFLYLGYGTCFAWMGVRRIRGLIRPSPRTR